MNFTSSEPILSLETSPNADDMRVVTDGLEQAVRAHLGAHPVVRFSVFLRSHDEKVIGGINARIAFGNLHVDQIWCEESVRERGFGTRLLARAEEWASRHQASASMLNTVDPGLVGFYSRRGYQTIAEIPGLLGGRAVYFMRKDLNGSNATS